MAAFASASALEPVDGSVAVDAAARHVGVRRWTRAPVRLAGALLAVASGFALWHGLSEQIAQALCVPPT